MAEQGECTCDIADRFIPGCDVHPTTPEDAREHASAHRDFPCLDPDDCPMTASTPSTREGELAEVTPRPWPENAWPTAAELADWLSRCTSDERLSYADHSLATAQRAAACVDRRHDDRLAEVEAERDAARATHRDLVSRLGFGDNITEPMADNDTIVAWFEQQGRDASEWVESQLWRNDCYAMGHPQDDDCHECDPRLALIEAREEIADLTISRNRAEMRHERLESGVVCQRLDSHHCLPKRPSAEPTPVYVQARQGATPETETDEEPTA